MYAPPGYTQGPGPTAQQLAERFPGAHVAASQGSPMQQQPLGPTGAQEAAGYLGYGTRGLQAANLLSNASGWAGGPNPMASFAQQYPGIGLIGPALGLAGAGLSGNSRGFSQALANMAFSPGLYSTLAGMIAPAGTAVAGTAAGTAAGMAGGAAAGLASLPAAAMGIAISINNMIEANNKAKAMERNVGRAKESGPLMQSFQSALQSGNLGAEIGPGVRAGDVLMAMSGMAARGELAGDYEGVFPSGRYQTLANQLAQQGFHETSNAEWQAIPGANNVMTTGDFISGLDEGAKVKQTRGPAFGKTQSFLDQLTKGLTPAFDSAEALRRSSMFSPHNVGRKESPFLLQFQKDVMDTQQPNASGMPMKPDTSLSAASSQQDILSRYVNDPESWRIGDTYWDPTGNPGDWTGTGWQGSRIGMAARAAQDLGLFDPAKMQAQLQQVQAQRPFDVAQSPIGMSRARDDAAAGGM